MERGQVIVAKFGWNDARPVKKTSAKSSFSREGRMPKFISIEGELIDIKDELVQNKFVTNLSNHPEIKVGIWCNCDNPMTCADGAH